MLSGHEAVRHLWRHVLCTSVSATCRQNTLTLRWPLGREWLVNKYKCYYLHLFWRVASGTFAVWPVSERLIVRRETSTVTIRTWKEGGKEGKKKAQADDWMCSGWRTHNNWISNKTLWSQDRPAAKTYTSSVKNNPPCTRKHRRHQKRHPRRQKMWNTPYTSNTLNTFTFEKDRFPSTYPHSQYLQFKDPGHQMHPANSE